MIYCTDCRFRIASNLRSEVSYCLFYNNPIEAVLGCENGESKSITNADRIRGKDDDGLADFFYNEAFLAPWCDMSCTEYESCRPCMLKWLKQPYNEKGENT